MIHIFRRYHSPAFLLDHLISEMELGLEFGHVFRSMPALRDMSERLVWRMGDVVRLPIVGPRGPGLADTCLTNGLSWLMDSEALASRGPAREMQTVYAAGLFLLAPELFHLHITVDGQPWSAAEGADLGGLQADGAQVAFQAGDEDPDSPGLAGLRMLMLTRLYPDGGHLLLDLDLKQVLWPPPRLHPSRDRAAPDVAPDT